MAPPRRGCWCSTSSSESACSGAELDSHLKLIQCTFAGAGLAPPRAKEVIAPAEGRSLFNSKTLQSFVPVDSRSAAAVTGGATESPRTALPLDARSMEQEVLPVLEKTIKLGCSLRRRYYPAQALGGAVSANSLSLAYVADLLQPAHRWVPGLGS